MTRRPEKAERSAERPRAVPSGTKSGTERPEIGRKPASILAFQWNGEAERHPISHPERSTPPLKGGTVERAERSGAKPRTREVAKPLPTTVDTWGAMLCILAGCRPPAVPDLPGRLHHLADSDADPTAEAWEAHQSLTTTTTDPTSERTDPTMSTPADTIAKFVADLIDGQPFPPSESRQVAELADAIRALHSAAKTSDREPARLGLAVLGALIDRGRSSIAAEKVFREFVQGPRL